MKKIVVTLLLFISFIGYSQTNGITYQAVILNPSGDQLPGVNNTNAPLANKNICLKFSIIDENSQFEYIETIQTTTDEFGMVNLIIGSGDQIGGYASSFSTILWNANPKSLKVDLSTTGVCSYYTEISNQPFTAVPFALFAATAGTPGTPGPAGPQGIQGVAGPTGATGPAGAVGPQGAQGLPGTNGTNGVDGAVGATGPQGLQGIQGPVGPQGAQGLPGTNGTNGIDGAVGPQGLQGVQGAVGPQGDQGLQGIQGVAGPTGADGPQGLQGVQGAVGPQGDQGLQGIQGVAGPTGADGPQGLQGVQGAVGPQGDQGLQGIQGVAGPQGDQGLQGIQGPIGPQGDVGPAGSDANVTIGAISTSSDPNGATITAGELKLAPADASNGGIITTADQTFSGSKTFGQQSYFNQGATLNGFVNGQVDMLDLNFFGPGFSRLRHDGFMFELGARIIMIDADFMDLFGNMHVLGQVDLLQNLNVDGNTTSNSFIKQNGLSTEFLKADGSVDNATYLTATGTAANVSGVVAIANGGTAATTAAEALTNLGAAPIDSPTFTGVPLAPTATAGISTTQIATTAFVTNAVSAASGAFVDLTSGQTIAGAKTFSSDIVVNGLTIGKGTGQNGDNTAIGARALNSSNANGTRNTAVGASALLNYIGTSFDNNTGVGYSNMAGLTTGDGNTSVGAETMLSVATGSNNTGIGNQSLISTSGNNNVGVGTRSGDGLTTGSNNTFLGTQAKTTSAGATVSNATAIGYAAEVGTDNTIQLGNATVTNVNTSGSYTGSGFKTPTGTPTQYLMADGSVSNGSSTTVGAISTSSDPNGATITAGELKLAPADASNGGIITTADQTFSGSKTFGQRSYFNQGATLNGFVNGQVDMLDLDFFGPGFNRLRHDGFMFEIGARIIMIDADFMDLFGDMHVFGQVDLQQNLNVNGNTTSNSFIKQGGTSSQYLMADGSVSSGSSTTIGAISSSSTANGATINSGELSLAPADASNGGIVTTGTQTFAGNKNFTGQLSIGTSNPESSAALDVTSTSQGFLPPRMTKDQRNAIVNKVAGLIVWCNNCGETGELQVYNGTAWTNFIGGATSEPLVVGSSYKGGKIAYIFQSGDVGYVAGEFHGIITSNSDLSNGIRWGQNFDGGTTTYDCVNRHGASGYALPCAIGAGGSNTALIISANTESSPTDYAALICSNYSVVSNGITYSDWFLPSKDELNKLYELKVLGFGNFSTDYWSSSEYEESYGSGGGFAWRQDFSNGSQISGNGKANPFSVRAVRYF